MIPSITTSTMMNPDLSDVIHQIMWSEGRPVIGSDWKPPCALTREHWAKLKGYLSWGCKLHVFWQRDVTFWMKEVGDEYRKWVEPDIGYLIALPGLQDDVETGVVWCPGVVLGDKGDTMPVWTVISMLLRNPEIAWVEVIK